jgi:hypothetical protein
MKVGAAGRRKGVGKEGKRPEVRDQRQETSNPGFRLQWFSVGRIRTAGTHPTGRPKVADLRLATTFSVLCDFELLGFQHDANYRVTTQDDFTFMAILPILAEIKNIDASQVLTIIAGSGEGIFIESQGVIQ